MASRNPQADLRHLLRGVFREQAKEPFLTLNLLRQRWVDVVGPELGGRTLPQRLDGRTLVVAAPDACWAYELQFFKAEVLSSVQAFLASQAVAEVRFRVAAPGDAAPAPQAPAAAGAAARTATAEHTAAAEPGAAAGAEPAPASAAAPPDAPPALALAAGAIGDPALRAVFQRSLAKQRRNRAAGAAGPRSGGAIEKP